MKKSPFLIFIAAVSVAVAAIILFIQSPQFAGALKRMIWKKLPADLGIQGDFTEFEIKLFPPGLAILSPRVSVAQRNILALPEGSRISAERIELNFRFFQMLSGDIRVNEVAIIKGDIVVKLDGKSTTPVSPVSAASKFKMDFRWDQVLKFRADSILIRDTHLLLEFSGGKKFELEMSVPSLRVSQWIEGGSPGLQLTAEAREFKGSLVESIPALRGLDRFDGSLRVNAEGVRVDRLNLLASGIEATATGTMSGNLRSTKLFGGTKDLSMELQLEAKGALASALALLKAPNPKDPPTTGAFSFAGKVTGSPTRLMDTLRAAGILKAQSFKRGNVEIESIELEGQWQSHGGSQGELSVVRAALASPERNRVGGNQPAGGGKIQVGAFKVALPPGRGDGGLGDPVTVPLTLEKAHIHWLAGLALEAVYGLDFRVNGPIELKFFPATPQRRSGWNVQSKVDLTVDGFQFDNQRWKKVRPLKRMIVAPKITLRGDIFVDEAGIKPDLDIETGAFTRLKLGGKIDFNTGYDLKGEGTAALEDIGAIAEIPVRGKGNLRYAVHGPSTGVQLDFDADIKDAYYLNLLLGGLKGVITWHDGLDDLIFRSVQLMQGRTSYSADGRCDFSEEGTIALKVRAPDGNVEDFMTVFSNLVHDLWWFPKSVNGPMRTEIDITGGLDMDLLQVASRVKGTNWRYFGETVDEVNFDAGYDRGKYYVSELAGLKHIGKFRGYISYAKDGLFDWDFRTDGFRLTDFDLFSKLDVPMRGGIVIQSNGKGKSVRAKEQSIHSKSRISVTDLNVRGKAMPASELLIRSESGVVQARGTALGGQGVLSLDYDIYPGSKSSLSLDVKQLDFSPVMLLLNPSLMSDPAFVANATGNVDLRFSSGELERASGEIGFKAFTLAKEGAHFELRAPRVLKLDSGTFELTDLTVKGPSGDAGFRVGGREGRIEGSLYGELDVSLAEFFTPTIEKAAGTATLDIAVAGTVKQPTFLGRMVLGSNGGSNVRVASLESPFENVTGAVYVRQNVLNVQNLQADLAGGRFSADGTVTLYASKYPTLNLKADLGGNKIKVYPFQLVKVRGWLGVHGEDIPYTVDGDVKIESALIREKIFQQKNKGAGLNTALYAPPSASGTAKSKEGSKFKLAIDAKADGGVIVNNDLFVAEFKGNLKVVNTLEVPRVMGTVDLVQGKLKFKDRDFTIQSASAIFDSPTTLNPRFNLTSSTEVSGTKIQLYASGRLRDWKAEVTSNPSLPEQEIISLLALGGTSNSRIGQDRSSVEQGEAASLLLNSLDFNREIESKTGFQIQLDESVNSQLGNSAFRPTTGESATAPKIVIKRRVGDRLELSYGSTLGIGSNTQKEGAAEFKVNRALSIQGVYDTIETVGVERTQRSYGLDLKWQKRFK